MSQAAMFGSEIDRPVVLVGMMGAGKTVLGRMLASTLGWEYLDTDAVVEQRAGIGIPEIFERYGEQKFREAERNALDEVLGKGPCVISTGGGLYADPSSREKIRAAALSVWLDVEPEILWERLKDSAGRPLLETQDPKRTLFDLLEKRSPAYAEADIRLPVGAEPPQETLQKLLTLLSERVNGARVSGN